MKDIFKKRQGIRREKPPTQDEVKVSTLRAQIRNAKSINEMAQVVNLWFESNADSTKANFFPDFPGITVDTLHQLFTATQQDPRNAEILQALLEQVTMVVSDVTAEHIITVIKQSPRGSDQPNTSKSTPRETPPTNPDPSPQPRRREQPTPIKVEDENEVFEILLGDLFRAKTLEATIEALQNWIRKYDKFQNTTPLIFSSFSPTQLLAELRAYASGTLNSLEEGTYIQGTGAVAMGMKEKIAEHLRKKSVINRKKVVIPPRAEEVGKPKTIAPEAAPVMPISEDLIGTPEMLRFRAELLAAKTLEAVLVLLNDCKILDEAITFKPQINAKPLARMLDAIINRKMEYKKIGFFNEVLLNFTEPDLSPVAKHLLQLAQNR